MRYIMSYEKHQDKLLGNIASVLLHQIFFTQMNSNKKCSQGWLTQQTNWCRKNIKTYKFRVVYMIVYSTHLLWTFKKVAEVDPFQRRITHRRCIIFIHLHFFFIQTAFLSHFLRHTLRGGGTREPHGPGPPTCTFRILLKYLDSSDGFRERMTLGHLSVWDPTQVWPIWPYFWKA